MIGRPILYKTTKEFLLRFGLKDVNELPSMEEFEKMAGELAESEAEAEDAAMRSGDELAAPMPQPWVDETDEAGELAESEAEAEDAAMRSGDEPAAPMPQPGVDETDEAGELAESEAEAEDAAMRSGDEPAAPMPQPGVEETEDTDEAGEPGEENALTLNIPPSPPEPTLPSSEEDRDEAAAKS